MRKILLIAAVMLLRYAAQAQQVLGDFTGSDQSEWPKVIWYRDTNNGWDEGLIKNGPTQSLLGRAGFGIHMHQSRMFTFWSTGWDPLLSIQGGTGNIYFKGNVGIGTLQANAKLDATASNSPAARQELLRLSHDQNNSFSLSEFGSSHPVWPSTIQLAAWNAEQNIAIVTDNQNNTEAGGSTKGIFIKTGGYVGIGTADPKGYKLAVAGNAIAESVTVKLQGQWGDYVFKPAYKLRPLNEVKAFINQNQHLPEVPSAQSIEKSGIDLGEMVKLQMKKIEELTLYLIEKDKQVNLLIQRVSTLEKKQTKPEK